MNILRVGLVELDVDQRLLVAFPVEIVAHAAPAWVDVPEEIGDLRVIGQRWVAHPQPDPAVPLDHWVAADARAGWNVRLARHLHTGAAAVVRETVIATLNGASDSLPAESGA
jgi:hypothetical protein